LPTNTQPTSPLSRLFRPDPHRELFRILADSLADAVLVLSPDGSSVLSCNHAFLLLTGFTRTDAEALAPIDLFPGEPGEQTLAALTGNWSSPEMRLEDVALKTHTGEIAPVDLSATSVGTPRFAVLLRLRPSSQRRRLQEREAADADRLGHLAALTAALLDGSGPTVGRALDVARQVLGAEAAAVYRVSAASREYVLDGFLPQDFPASLPPEQLDPLFKPGVWSLGQRPDHPLHKAARSAGWTVLRTSPLGAPSAWIGVLLAGWANAEQVPPEAETLLTLSSNVCHAALVLGLQQAAMADIQGSTYQIETDVKALLSGLREGVLTLDQDLRVERVNRAAAELLGYQPREMEGQVIQDVLVGPKDVRPLLLDALGHDLQTEETAWTFHRRDGTAFPAFLRVLPTGSAGRARLLLVLGDRSEHQAAETRNEVLTQRALLGEVSAIFAHEVRNPINNISTGVQLVSSRLGPDHPLHDSLERIRKECIRLDQLMSDVLFFARPLELKMEPLELAEMIRRLLERWKPRLSQSSVHIHTAFDPAAGRALADPRTLEQVVVNLLTNALQAMAQGGTLSVTLAPSVDGQAIDLKVADTGPGIPPDVVERIFDPFFTTKKDGTGLGLAISRRIVAAHKGALHVESYAGAGTVFTIRLPRLAEDEAPA
jgi:two-component system sensor histidine kinase AtoS